MKHNILLSIFLLALFFSFVLQAQEVQKEQEVQDEIKETSALVQAEDEVNILFGTQKYRRFVGNASAVKSEDLQKYPAMLVMESLTGRLPGVFIQQLNGVPGGIPNYNFQSGQPGIHEDFNIYVRGNIGTVDNNTNTNYLILIDGVERNVTFYDLEQIEEIRVLKDPVSKAFFGGRMSNGVIMITTKTGDLSKRKGFRVNLQQGWKAPTRLPKYLNSYDFATRYNEASINDGLAPRYSDEELQGYKAGNKPIQYPDVDFYGEILNNMMQITRANAEYTGGDQRTSYFVHGGFQTEGGLEKYGEHKTDNSMFNLQGNITSHYSEFITLTANVTGMYKMRDYPGDGLNFNEFSQRRPNAYPIYADAEKTRFGGVSGMLANPMALTTIGGYTRENNIILNTDIGLEFKLDKLIEGLSIKPRYSYDAYHRQDLNKRNTAAIWAVSNFNDQGIPQTVNPLRVEQIATAQSRGLEVFQYRWSFNNLVSLERQFGKHELSADYQYYMSMQFFHIRANDYKRLNNALRLNYTYDKRYTVEGALVYAGSDRFVENNKFKAFPSFGAGWLLSEESFLKDAKWLNFLKLNASWGIIGDGDYYNFRWRQEWEWYDRNYTWSPGNSNAIVAISRIDNYALDWQKNRQIDVNLEAVVAEKISGKFTYFNFLQYDLINQMYEILPHPIGWSRYYPFQNYSQLALRGTEIELRYTETFNNLKLNVGGHLTYAKSERIKWDENPDPNYSTIGTPTDAIRGYRWDGYYTQAEIDQLKAGTSNLPLPTYMDYKGLKAGDIKYKDLNGEGKLDKYDYEIIGNSSPRMMYGIDVNLQYGTANIGKIELSLLISGMGAYKRYADNLYYRNFSTRKYSNVLIDGLPNGNPHPTLTTGSMTNDVQGSDYWIVNGGYMKLKNTVLAYSLPDRITQGWKMKDLKISLYGTNLLTFSQIKELDPESLNAGIDRWPLFKTFAIGLSANF